VDTACANLRQGHVVALHRVPVMSTVDSVTWMDTPLGVVIISQTCDVVLPSRRAVTIAPVFEVPVEKLPDALSGKQSRLVHLPDIGARSFVHLENVATIDKEFLEGLSIVPGFDLESLALSIEFSSAIARHFARFAFPNDFVPWISPFERTVLKKHSSDESFEGKALREVIEFRLLESGGWLQPPYDVSLIAIVKFGTLPLFDNDGIAQTDPGLERWLRDSTGQLIRSGAQISEALFSTGRVSGRDFAVKTSSDREILWTALAEAWASSCKPKSGTVSDAVKQAVKDGQIVGRVESEADFSLMEYRRSVQLDVDFVSVSELDSADGSTAPA